MLYGWVEDSGSTELLLRLKYLKAMYLSTYYPSLPLHPLLSLHSETSSRFLLLRLSLYFTTSPTPASLPSSPFFPSFSKSRTAEGTSNILKTLRLARIHPSVSRAPRGWIYSPARFSILFLFFPERRNLRK